MSARYDIDSAGDKITVIKGCAPVSKLQDYNKQVMSYSHGAGRLSYVFYGYDECTSADAVLSQSDYNPENDIINTPDSFFCSHGGGFLVKWNQVFDYMHIPLVNDKKENVPEPLPVQKKKDFSSMIADEEELLRIFEATYGKIKRRLPDNLHTPKEINPNKQNKKTYKPSNNGPEYLLIDGYNIIFAWDDLKEIAQENIDLARSLLIDKVCNYRAINQNNVIVVFDAYKVKGNFREIETKNNVTVIYTKEAETADQYIEKSALELSKNYRVRVATSDGLIQMIIFGNGAIRVTPRELRDEIDSAEIFMRKVIQEHNSSNSSTISELNSIKENSKN